MLNIINIFLFFISPFLALPSVLYGFINKSKFNLYLFMLIVGLLSAVYIPHIENDKARYYEMYENVKMLDIQGFLAYNYLSNLDFLFQFLIYIASINAINIQYVFFVIAFITIGLFFNVFLKLFEQKQLRKVDFAFLILLCLFSISIEDIFSGIRFMLASAIMLNAYYFISFENKFKKGIILSFVAILVHFSLLIFVFPVILMFFLKKHDKLILNLFFVSILFILIPQSLLIDVFSKIGFSGVLQEKNNAYLGNEDFVSTSIKEVGEAVRIRYLLYSLWIYVSYIYIYFTRKIKSNFRTIFLLSFIILNVFWAFPTVFFRYSIFVKIILMCLIIIEFEIVEKRMFKNLFMFSFFVIFSTQLLLMRYNFEASYLKRNVFYLYDFLASDPIKEYDFLK